MNAYKIKTVVTTDGTIILKGIPFSAGKSVEIIVLGDLLSEQADRGSVNLPLDERWKSLQGSVTRYDDPFESAIPLSDWEVLQ